MGAEAEGVRLQKVLSQAGIASRRVAERMITDGRVSDCSITASSGSTALDTETCNILRRRARFTPAKDQAGNPITDSFSQRIRWELPED